MKNRFFKYLFLVNFFFGVTFLSGQEKRHFPNLTYLTSDQGLSQNEVTCILEDKKGFIWIGTRGGLNRYDGHEFEIFQNEIGNTNSLINNSIESLFEDSKGNIWIGTKSNGVSCYDPEMDQFIHYQYNPLDSNSLSGNRIISIAESTQGHIWLGTRNNGLNILDATSGAVQHFLSGQQITDIISTSDKQMGVTSNSGLLFFNNEGGLLESYQQVPNIAAFQSIVEAAGNFYLGTWNSGLYKFDPTRESFEQYVYQGKKSKEPLFSNMYALHQDQHGAIWIGSWGGGLIHFNPETESFRSYDLAYGMHSGGQELYNDVLCIYQSKSGVLWFGTNGGGLVKLNQRQQQFGLEKEGSYNTALPREPIWSIYKDQQNTLWVSAKGSPLVYFNTQGDFNGRWSTVELDFANQFVLKKGVRSICEAKDSSLWMGTNQRLFQVVGPRTEPVLAAREIKLQGSGRNWQQRLISDLYVESSGTFWIGSQQNGLFKSVNPGTPANQEFVQYQRGDREHGLHNNRISALLEDRTGRFWIGTYGGLHLYRPAQDDFLHYGKEQGQVNTLSSDIIICLYEDQKGNLWVGTPNGLNLAIPGENQSLTFRCFQEKDGLPNNYIHAILEDQWGNLWVSTNKGISKFDPQEKVFYNFDVNDGLHSNAFMEGAAFKDDIGKFYFGGINGVNAFHPDSVSFDRPTPKILFTGLNIFNEAVKAGQPLQGSVILERAIEYTQELTLSHQENVFSIDYTALDFESPSGNTFMFKMEGLDEGWNKVGNQRRITFSNLPPGAYTLKVKTADNAAALKAEGAQLKINILPAYWATQEAFVLYLLIFVGLLLAYRYYLNQHHRLKTKLELARLGQKKNKELAEMKSRFFDNITHELRTPLTLIMGPVETLLETPSNSSQRKYYLSTIQYHTQRLLGLLNQLLDFRKAESGHLKLQVAEGNVVKFAREVFLSFRANAERKNILFQFYAGKAGIPLTYDRNNMEIVLCNLLSNALKYTPDNEMISFSIKEVVEKEKCRAAGFPQGFCEFIVEDTGVGVSKAALEQVFDRYYQVSRAESVKMVGTGIGLALVKNIVELHHGKVLVESTPQKGTTFTVQLPLGQKHFSSEQFITNFKKSEDPVHYQWLLPPEEVKEEISVMSHRPASEKTLLVVEDNHSIRRFIRNIFEQEYHILEAADGHEALEIVDEELPDLIISDLMMPGMDGLTLCQQIRSAERTSHLPLIILTARTSTVYEVDGFDSGADAYVTKPFRPAVLKAKVKALIDSRELLKKQFSKKITLRAPEAVMIELPNEEELFLDEAIRLVEENLTNEQLNRDFMAQKMAMSASTYYRKIKQITGLSTNAFIRSIRLKKAAELMAFSQKNISEIAYQVGFNDLKYFRKCFKGQFGMPPSQFTKNQSVEVEKEMD